MSRYAVRQAALAALAANAIRPLRGRYSSVFSFVAGWLTSELAPQLLALSAADTAAEVTVRRRRGRASGPVAQALGLAGAAGLGYLVLGARRTSGEVEESLTRELGRGWFDLLESDEPELPVSARDWARPFALRDRDVEVERDVNYTRGGRRARLDIYRPRGVELHDAPVLVQIHGGGWTIGAKEQQGLILMNRMAKRGWVCVAVNYRLAPKHPWPAMIDDVRTALEWVKEHIGAYGGDPSYVVTTGGSAGGHLSALAALTVPGIAGCVPFYGVYDMANLTEDRFAEGMRDFFLAPRVFRRRFEDDPDAFVEASPLAQVTADAPDFFVLHGSNDTLVNVAQARAFVQRLRETSKRTVVYHELPGAQHAFEVFNSIRSHNTIRAVQRWLEWHHAEWRRRQAEGEEPTEPTRTTSAGQSQNPLADDVAQDLGRAAGDR